MSQVDFKVHVISVIWDSRKYLHEKPIDFILLREVQTNFLMLRTGTEMQNDIGMMSQIIYFWFLSLF